MVIHSIYRDSMCWTRGKCVASVNKGIMYYKKAIPCVNRDFCSSWRRHEFKKFTVFTLSTVSHFFSSFFGHHELGKRGYSDWLEPFETNLIINRLKALWNVQTHCAAINLRNFHWSMGEGKWVFLLGEDGVYFYLTISFPLLHAPPPSIVDHDIH